MMTKSEELKVSMNGVIDAYATLDGLKIHLVKRTLSVSVLILGMMSHTEILESLTNAKLLIDLTLKIIPYIWKVVWKSRNMDDGGIKTNG
jgi:hypothetical protein